MLIRLGSRQWAGIAALLAVGFVAACGSGSQEPQSLTGTQAGAHASSQYTAEDHQAATTLTPEPGSFLAGKTTVTLMNSTTPANGDVNPYAIWPVTQTVGSVTAGDVLVDNFNNKSNNQGTGTTIVDVQPNGQVGVFAHLPSTVPGCTGGVGLTTAMVQLKTGGWVIVGSVPSTNGKINTVGAGCLLVLSATGQLAGTIPGPYLDGPWDATVRDNGSTATLFVANTLVGLGKTVTAAANRGTVVRLSLSESATSPPKVTDETTVADGFPERADAAAFVKGPTGLALSPTGTRYVADNVGNRIAAIPNALTRTNSAGTGTTLTSGGQLANPLGLALAPNGDLLAANATNGKIVEITPSGNGDLFGLAINQAGTGVLFVKDDTNALALLH